MDSRVPVRHLSKTVCLVVILLGAPAGAQIDSPGTVSFHFLAEPDAVYQTFEQVPKGAELTYSRTKAYLSSDASDFEDSGVRIWTGFDLEGPDGLRHAMLILDIDLHDPSAVRAEYMETRNDRILFDGYLMAAEANILDVWLDGGDAGSVEGEFECIFMDPANRAEGTRVLLAGHFFTEARPQRETPNTYYQNDSYVETGCGSDVYVEDDYEDSGCEGDTYDSDYESSGCGGSDYDDDYDYGGSCEGDTYDSGSDSGCGGDSYDSGYSDSSSCEGDSYDSYDSSDSSGGLDCEGDEAYAAVLKPSPRKRRRPNPLRAIMRMFPEIVGISFIVFLKRRFRAGRL
jgi:hypothetical protein